MNNKLPAFFHVKQLDFHPKYEWALGNRIKHPETTKRAENIYRNLKKEEWIEITEPPSIPLKAIRDSHNYQLITLYNTAMTLPDEATFYPSVFPQRKIAKPDPTNITHAGFYCFDSGTPLNNKTWQAASWSAASSFYAAKNVLKTGKVAYALSRPPGHHATRDTYGGYCYFNNAAIAAKLLRTKGRVALLDIDFHHGNGSQEIFYRDDRVFVASIHGDPREYFPYFAGYPSEVGEGKGEGLNQNLILPAQTKIKAYLSALRNTIIPAIKRFEPSYLIVSAGFDTYKLDPIGNFALETEDYEKIGKEIAKMKLPTVICQEGGYFTKDLGLNVVSFLSGFKSNL
ncbi:MAG: histone deacetylase family protein [Halobacteriovoraceae bacterium]|nr:histone deacetylase family protein [Halobacteriovoraceae bacterium]